MLNKMTVVLSNESGRTRDLEYQILGAPSAQLWARRLQLAIASGLRETDRFLNFPKHEGSDPTVLIRRLQDLIATLKTLHPDLEFPPFDPNDLQGSVNQLHNNFAHSHLVTRLINPDNVLIWTEFNVVLHALEVVDRNMAQVVATGMHRANIVFTWNDHRQIPIPDEFYEDFNIGVQFGAACANYSQIGRNMYELFLAKDDQLNDEHIQPFRYISGDTFLWFGPDTSPQRVEIIRLEMERWFGERKERFHRLGLSWEIPSSPSDRWSSPEFKIDPPRRRKSSSS